MWPCSKCLYMWFVCCVRLHSLLLCVCLNCGPAWLCVCVCPRTCTCVSLVHTQFLIVCVCEWIESACRSMTDCSTTKSGYGTSVRLSFTNDLNLEFSWLSLFIHLYIFLSHPSWHCGGAGRLWPGDMQALYRQIARGKSVTSSELFSAPFSTSFISNAASFLTLGCLWMD